MGPKFHIDGEPKPAERKDFVENTLFSVLLILEKMEF